MKRIIKTVAKLLGDNHAQGRQEQEFLPAALEVVETPPSPIGRTILWMIMAFFTIAVIWSMLGEVDIVAVAPGKIIPSGRVKVIQPLEAGVVKRIAIEEGQHVKQGQLLIELDSTTTGADRERLIAEREAAILDQARLNALLASIEQGQSASITEYLATKHDTQKILLFQNQHDRAFQDYTAQVASLKQEIKQREAELAAARNRIEQLTSTIPLITERSDALKKMVKDGLGSRNQWLELEEERIGQVKERDIQRNNLNSTKAAIASLNERLTALKAQTEANFYGELTQVNTRIDIYDQELIKAEQRNTLQQLKSPINGVVQQLAIHTIGGVVTPAQELMTIVPDDEQIEVEAWIQNKDIGFVKEGQIAEVKIEAFPFTKYGTIDAVIKTISDDAVTDEDKGLIYNSRVTIKQSTIQIEERVVRLSPGMAVTVETKTGKRKLIEFLMSPLLRYKDESVRER